MWDLRLFPFANGRTFESPMSSFSTNRFLSRLWCALLLQRPTASKCPTGLHQPLTNKIQVQFLSESGSEKLQLQQPWSFWKNNTMEEATYLEGLWVNGGKSRGPKIAWDACMVIDFLSNTFLHAGWSWIQKAHNYPYQEYFRISW